MISSEPYKQVADDQRLYEYAIAYLTAAIELLAIIETAERRQTWPDVAVVNMLAAHASELFLKAIILRAGHQYAATHDLERLRRQAAEIGVLVDFHLPMTQVNELPPEFLRTIRDDPASHDPSIVNRYPFANVGLNWRMMHFVEPRDYLAVLDEVRESMANQWNA